MFGLTIKLAVNVGFLLHNYL